jgi:hypothetical protein
MVRLPAPHSYVEFGADGSAEVVFNTEVRFFYFLASITGRTDVMQAHPLPIFNPSIEPRFTKY